MMSNEEFDRKVEFILNQQARFDARFEADMQALREAQKETDEKVKHMFDGFEEAKQLTIQTREDLAELTTLTTEGFRILYENSRNTDAKIAALVNAHIETEEMFRKTDAKVADLVKSQIETEEMIRDTKEMIRETDAMLQDTNATLRDTNATVRNIGVKFDRHLKEDHNSG